MIKFSETKKELNEDVTGTWGEVRDTFYSMYLPEGKSVNTDITYTTFVASNIAVNISKLVLTKKDSMSYTDFWFKNSANSCQIKVSNSANAAVYEGHNKGVKIWTKDYTLYIFIK